MASPDFQSTVYIGTYTSGESEGIYVYRLNPDSGALTLLSVTGGVKNPSFLAIAPGRRHLYAVSEIGDVQGTPQGGVSAFAIDARAGGLTLLNQQPSQGNGPCHLSVDATGRYVLVANYQSGSLGMLPIQPDGRLGPATESVQHSGSSVDPDRQSGPRAHSITPDPTNRYALAADLGIDQVLAYRLELSTGRLVAIDAPYDAVPGAGPRHLDFHPNGRYAYLINELNSTVTALVYVATAGALTEINTLPALPDDFNGLSHTADIHVSPSGRFVYGSNRGHDSIVIYEIDPDTGGIALVGFQPTEGKTPRNFAIDPSGKFLLAANQHSDTIVTFRIDPDVGTLAPTRQVAQVPSPVCVKFSLAAR